MNTMIKSPATVEELGIVDADRFTIAFHITCNATTISPILTRLELAKLVRLGSEALRATQDQVVNPELLAAVVVL